jgi:hypothetical protein
MSFKSFFKHLGHAIEHAAKDVVHGVENIAKDAVHAGEAAIHMADDVAHGRFKAALNDAVRCAQCSVKAFTELPKMEIEAICDATTDMHLNKSLDKMAQKVKGFEDKAVDFERNVADKMVQDVADAVEGTVNGTINAAKDIASGDFRKACGDVLGVAGDAVSLACDLTPEGMAANAVVGAMEAGHVGNSAVQGFVGDIVGGPKGLFKRAAESGAGLAAGAAANEVAQKIGSVPGGDAGAAAAGGTVLAAGAAAPLAADALSGRHRHRGGGTDAGHDPAGHRGAPNADAGKGPDTGTLHTSEKLADTGAGKGTDKTACKGTDKPADASGDKDAGKGTDKGTDKVADKDASKGTDKVADKDADKRKDKDGPNGSDAAQAGADVGAGAGAYGAAGADISAAQASAYATMAAQDAIARIQNAIALNQAKNQVEDELGKGVKALSQ